VLSAISGVASAQSSVTLSGIVDAGIRRQGTLTGYDWNMAQSQSAYSAFTISGREDLGGGMNAFFGLNHRFNIASGTINSQQNYCNGKAISDTISGVPCGPVSTFYRNAWLGLGGAFGDVRLGRILMPLQDMNGGFDPFDTGTVGSTHTGGITATIRANNAIYYRSPNISGLTVHAAIAAGENQLQGETANNVSSVVANSKLQAGGLGQRPTGFAVRYAAGPLNVGLAYDRNLADYKTTGVYGQYNFGAFMLQAQYESGDGNIGVAGPQEKMKAMSIGARIPLGPVLIRTGYVRFNSNLSTCNLAASGAASATGGTLACDSSKFGFGGDYNLSKRTLIYSDIGKSSGDRLSTAAKKAQFDLGIRHFF
jgi:predicted porin